MEDDITTAAARPGPIRRLGETVLRHSTTYVFGSALELVLVLVRLALLTRLLPIGSYGQLAILLIYAGFVSTGLRGAVVTGSLVSAFRGMDDDEGGLISEDEKEEKELSRGEQRRLLGTGLLLSIIGTLLLGALAFAVADPLEATLIGAGDIEVIVFATILGGLGGVWRLLSAIPRFETRPVAYVALQLVHTVAGIVCAVILIEAGYGLSGAIGGLTLGAALACIPALYVSRHRFALAFDLADARTVVRRGLPFIALIVAFWVFRNVDIYLVSRYLPDSDVALYRVGARIGALASAGITALLLAWGPLTQGRLRDELREHGSVADAGGRLFTYFGIFSAWILVGLALLSSTLIRLAPGDYESARALIPLLGLAAVLASGTLVAHRVGQHSPKLKLLTRLGFVMSALVAATSVFLIPAYGIYGATVAIAIAPLFSIAVILRRAQQSEDPLPIDWRRIGTAAALAAVWIPAALLALDAAGLEQSWPLQLLGTMLFPLALAALGVVGRKELSLLRGLSRNLLTD